MSTLFVCLLEGTFWGSEEFDRGEIVCGEPGHFPPAVAFASFKSPAELSGVPEFKSCEDHSGTLLFKYSVDGDVLLLRARVGLPTAQVVMPGEKEPTESPDDEVKLEFGASLAPISGRSCMRWGRCLPVPPVEEKWEDIDWLRRGL